MRLPAWLPRVPRRQSRLERLVERSLQAGVGLHRNVWEIARLPLSTSEQGDLAGAVAAWVEDTMGRTRRPYGINQLAVGLACARPGATPLTSASLGMFRPVDYYSDGGVRDQIGEFVRSLPLGEADTPGTPLRVAAALFSWGDLARATVFRD